MENTNSKIITASFAACGVILGVTVHLLIKAFSGAFGIIARISNYDVVSHGLPIISGIAVFAVCQFHPKVQSWAREVVVEVRRVIFPSRKETVSMNISVIIMVLISAVVIMAMDWISGIGLNTLIDLAK